ncbi:hypothetical protein, partial [Sporomusa sphaeroides]|uniref:hypothetical protein n=1 Tax=Sporomusa sphaeroides TaxID=47679 RepID=UPI00315888F5
NLSVISRFSQTDFTTKKWLPATAGCHFFVLGSLVYCDSPFSLNIKDRLHGNQSCYNRQVNEKTTCLEICHALKL